MIERWDIAEHLPLIEGWIRARGLGDDAGDVTCLPPTGFVVDRMAAGFLYRTDATLCFAGSMVADPGATKEARGCALSMLIVALRDEARALGYRRMACTPSVASLKDRLRRHGFTVVDGCAYALGGV